MVTITIALLICLVVLTTLSVFYEGIFAPHLKIRMSYKILALKIQLRELKKTSLPDNEAIELVENSIEWASNNLKSFTIGNIYLRKRPITKDQLSTLIIERNSIIEKFGTPELKAIVNALDECLFRVLIINCGGFFFWLSPLILLNYIRNRFAKAWPDSLRASVKSFVYAPEMI